MTSISDYYWIRVVGRRIRTALFRWRYERMERRFRIQHYVTQPVRSEVRAWNLFAIAQRAHDWFPRDVYPAGGAAGPLLLYLLTRIVTELPIRRVLELGAGASSIVLSAWAEHTHASVVTLEHDERWADRIRKRVAASSSVIHAPLTTVATARGATQWYDDVTADALGGASFDLLLVDGPIGTRTLSRFGIAPHVPALLNREWVILWDDIDRLPDLESFGAVLAQLRERGIDHDHVVLDGDRTIGLIFTPAFGAVKYLW